MNYEIPIDQQSDEDLIRQIIKIDNGWVRFEITIINKILYKDEIEEKQIPCDQTNISEAYRKVLRQEICDRRYFRALHEDSLINNPILENAFRYLNEISSPFIG